MEKGKASSLFVNDGSFMEKFKQLEQEKGPALGESKPGQTVSGTSIPKPIVSKTSFESKANDFRKTTPVASSGKLAFSLKQKSKLVAPSVKLSEDEDEEESVAGNALGNEPAKRQKLGQPDDSEQSSKQVDVAPPPPSDPTVKKVADKLASFVAKTGRQFEHITRKKNPGDTPFKYTRGSLALQTQLHRMQAILLCPSPNQRLAAIEDPPFSSPFTWFNEVHVDHGHFVSVGGISTAALSPTSGPQRSLQQHSNYQTPASALYEAIEDTRASMTSVQTTSAGRSGYGTPFFFPVVLTFTVTIAITIATTTSPPPHNHKYCYRYRYRNHHLRHHYNTTSVVTTVALLLRPLPLPYLHHVVANLPPLSHLHSTTAIATASTPLPPPLASPTAPTTTILTILQPPLLSTTPPQPQSQPSSILPQLPLPPPPPPPPPPMSSSPPSFQPSV
ncbi:hypothetical protein TEA_006904 [Camellia sinensis var. sinensis]|uniref:SURP motif domain-containing protein n=1 Tax=Camellia sinensis var. sinensis TaxID=542762 RepID=A0A4S4DDV4_CAMSN|nr:hypothetical protein TEA_006904 [Camellia sinensis var. sinensis]